MREHTASAADMVALLLEDQGTLVRLVSAYVNDAGNVVLEMSAEEACELRDLLIPAVEEGFQDLCYGNGTRAYVPVLY